MESYKKFRGECRCRFGGAEIEKDVFVQNSGVPTNFFSGGGVQQIQLRTEDIDDGDLGAVAP